MAQQWIDFQKHPRGQRGSGVRHQTLEIWAVSPWLVCVRHKRKRRFEFSDTLTDTVTDVPHRMFAFVCLYRSFCWYFVFIVYIFLQTNPQVSSTPFFTCQRCIRPLVGIALPPSGFSLHLQLDRLVQRIPLCKSTINAASTCLASC